MEIALSTDYAGTSRDYGEIGRTLKEMADHGITHVQWCHEWEGDYCYSTEELQKIRTLLREYGLGCKGIHATAGWRYLRQPGMYQRVPTQGADYTSQNEEARLAGVEVIRNRLEMAAVLGTREIVLHMQLPYVRFAENPVDKTTYYRQAFKSFDQLEPFARKRDVRICVENLVGTPNSYQFEQFDQLFSRYAPSYLGLCFDTGHAQLTDETQPLAIARRYQARLYQMHLNDHHGYAHPGNFGDDVAMSLADEHLVMGDGIVDFVGFAQIVAASPYEFPVVGEFACRTAGREAFFQKTVAGLTEFSTRILQTRTAR